MKKKLKPTAKVTPSPQVAGALVEKVPAKKTARKTKTNGEVAVAPNGTHLKNGTNGNGNGKSEVYEIDLSYSSELDNRELLRVLSAVRDGNFSVRMPEDKQVLEVRSATL